MKIIQDNIYEIIEYIGDDPLREGLLETPQRVLKSWSELYCGYYQDPKDVFKLFDASKYDEMIVLKQIDFFSTCEHHMLPFFGTVDIGYVPNGKVIGLSKLARVVEIFSRRLQIQEQMTIQIADCIWENLSPKGVMVVVRGQHLCMMARGVRKENAVMVTSAIKGVFEKKEARDEFMNLIA